MRVIDIKSIIIGILITLLFLAVYGFRSETDELGHLVVKSITVADDRGGQRSARDYAEGGPGTGRRRVLFLPHQRLSRQPRRRQGHAAAVGHLQAGTSGRAHRQGAPVRGHHAVEFCRAGGSGVQVRDHRRGGSQVRFRWF